MKLKKFFIATLFLLATTQPLLALNFLVQNIKIQGLTRINRDTVMSYLPIRSGQRITTKTSDNIINALYKTGFFSNVSLSREGNTLVVSVQERPVITKITLAGNKIIPSKNLVKILKQMGIAEGYEYNQSLLKTIKTGLLNQYYAHGKYNAHVNISTQKAPHNGIAVSIDISEGITAKIKNIHITGNHAFNQETLLGQFKLSTPGLFSFFTKDDLYSSDQLSADLEALQTYYLNEGYLRFKIDSVQVSLSPDRQEVYINVVVNEGAQYTFSGYTIAGKLILPKTELKKVIPIEQNTTYSKRLVNNAQQAIIRLLGKKGYYRANVDIKTNINDQKHTVFINYTITPGRLIYVRHIHFKNNGHTNDFAFRRMLSQLEGSLVSTNQLKMSKQRLLQQSYIKNVDMKSQRVPNTNNQVDLNYNITTAEAGSAKAGLGYSDVDGVLLNASITQQNIFGTGNSFGINGSYSASLLSGSISYYNPYYSHWGVGRGFNLYASHYNADKANISDYSTDNYGSSLFYSIPISPIDSIQAGFNLDYLKLQLGTDPATVMSTFANEHGRDFPQIPLNLTWTHNSLNRAIFPTHGLMQSIGAVVSAPINSQSLEYYKLNYNFVYYQPIYHQFIGTFRTNIGYGGGYGRYDRLPFFKNYYAGGIGSIRGFQPNTLGPQDSKGDSIGGNLLTTASIALVFPNPFSNSLRTSAFVDAGNVFDTKATAAEKANNPDRNRIRVSTGIEFDWLSPMGLLNFSLAKAINPAPSDDTGLFNFTAGTTF